LLDSKFGGLAYWDSSLPYPTDPRGVPMQLLAQINFGQFQAEAPLPRRGLLQFFIARDDVFGADFHHPEEQKGFRAVYRPEIDPRITSEQAAALERAAFPPGAEGDEEQAYCSPVCKEAAVLIQKKIAYMGPCDCRFEQTFRRAVQKALGVKMPEKQSHYAFLCKEDRDELWKELSNAGHWLLGYPYFTQDDPRQPEGPFDTLLFQMDSDMEGALDYVLWGDCGVGNFFINRKDLENLDFSRVLYSWDCC
jgi:uncharacterized protein YwqG